jgi:hypothetical protein
MSYFGVAYAAITLFGYDDRWLRATSKTKWPDPRLLLPAMICLLLQEAVLLLAAVVVLT